jgi:anti-sigma regulatory factor (Ser/Thr protein kinase)
MVKSHTNQKHKKQKYEKQKHEKKMKLMRKPIWWVELLVAAAVCTVLIGTLAYVSYRTASMMLYNKMSDSVDDMMGSVHERMNTVQTQDEFADSVDEDSAAYIRAYNTIMWNSYLNGEVLMYVTNEDWLYNHYLINNCNTLYRLYDSETFQRINLDGIVNKNEPFTIMCVRNLDTGISGYYVCDDSGLTKVLDNRVSVYEYSGDICGVKNIADPCIGKVYLRDSENGSSFTIQGTDRHTDGSVFYDGPADASGYSEYDVTLEKLTFDDTINSTFVMNGEKYVVTDIRTFRDMDQLLETESDALDRVIKAPSTRYVASGQMTRLVWTCHIGSTSGDFLFGKKKIDYAGNDVCGIQDGDGRVYAAMEGRVTLANSRQCILAGVCSYDADAVIRELAGDIRRIAIWCIACITVFATAVIYMTRKTRYDRQEYRLNMTNAMAHDLKTPLMAMSGYAENLLANVHTDKRQQYAEAISENVRRMNGMIEQMLEIDRLETGKRRKREKLESVDMTELFRKVVEENEVAIQRKNMVVTFEGNCTLNADMESMKHVAENLVTNAVRHGMKNGIIDIEMADRKVTISNTTDDVLPDDIDSLWDPYVKGSGSRTGGGSGLGLFVVRTILDKYGLKGRLSYHDGTFSVLISSR